MAGYQESPRGPHDGLVTFLPHRLNRHPVVVRGLTADELWVCAGLSAVAGFLAGMPLAWLTRSIAMVPTLVVVGIGIGVFVAGGFLRRQKRGRPDTWLYRQLQWRTAVRHPSLAAHVGGRQLIARSGWWSTRRLRPSSRQGTP
jgi:conjugative transfer region protein (TIGR03750 family)